MKAFKKGSANAATVGSCIILIIVKDNKMYVANCGDAQAKLFSYNPNKNSHLIYTGKRLNNIHNASQKEEQERLVREYSDEEDIILSRKGSDVYYVKGMLQCTRVRFLL